MASLAAARAALVTLVGASEESVDPPATYVYSSGTDSTRLGGSSVEWEFRVTVSGGMQSNGAASAAVATLLAAKLSALQASPLYRILRVSPDQVRTSAGGDQLTADIAVSCKVDI